ncbi:glycoside hydrolase family 25 protein [Pontibacter silvestris]|uniref:Glycoside hydrolase family 25 protein n=1 Tax=Pontibacter silvestris TaxID=2305183 RepID=A0ABW4X1V0_9BACT|nr:glycoside hydrolase family 25 protein [Pontibacter silvestris]MCC9135040.1 glycoside hydrolase family 25 protein [Pontibacter silvestris]
MKTAKAPVKRNKRKEPKKQQSPVLFWVGLAGFVGLVLFVLYFEIFVEKKKPIWPEGYSVYGIDVSHYQRDIDWEKVRLNEVAFAFLKATEGKSLRDKNFMQNWQNAREAGIIRGAYHFYRPHVKPEKQAEHFIATVPLEPGDLPPVLDVEVKGLKSKKKLREDLQVWLALVEEAYGAKPIIYTNYKFYVDNLQGYFDDYHLWIAHYKVPKPRLERNDTVKLAFWQHTDAGAVDGIEGIVDCNVFYGSMRELRSVCIKEKL